MGNAPNTADDGVFTFYASPDLKPGSYEIVVTPPGGSCTKTGCKTHFTMLGSPPPPPTPPTQPDQNAWEVPIIQAFKGSFGLDELKKPSIGDHPAQTATVPGGGTSGAYSGYNCEYVCHVVTTSNGIVGGRRRLLFGGLQYYDAVDTKTVVGCSKEMEICGCCP